MVFLYPLVFALALPQPIQARAKESNLKLTNNRLTYGEFGATRTDSRYLPGDAFCFAFEIEGIKSDESGKVRFTMGMELTDSKGKEVFKQAPVDREEYLTLGGNRLPARAFVRLGMTQLPGTYTCKITIFDRATGDRKSIEQKFEVLSKNLGIINVLYSSDQEGAVSLAPVGVAGQTYWLQCSVVGFERNPLKKLPDLDIEMTAFEKGKQLLQKPIMIGINDKVGPTDEILPVQFLVPLSRPGDFTIELKVTDKVSKKVNKVTLPLKVLSATDR
jgi:hypothetical protein